MARHRTEPKCKKCMHDKIDHAETTHDYKRIRGECEIAECNCKRYQ